MEIRSNIPLLEEILAEYKDVIGEDFRSYKNHVYRVVNFCLRLKQDTDNEQEERIIIAACFHDLGIWANDTFDYLQPSIVLAKEYLKRRNLEKWSVEIELMIDTHHKIRKYEDDNHPLVEVFRKADLIDVSLGMVKFSLSTDFIGNIKITFPNSGFHKRLIQLTVRELFRNPLKPLPMIRW
ncbi:MAG: HD domain-containing protein [Desulfobacula sp.]|uniref:HD domain-containing protein n=1 Tax=Desulfobacula sp. TaxID=2593537 RepID=UPI0025BBDDAF|nr:HD domain-containing protein [Desulfobacula sp.]MCD4719912.1 HD domain-containing protein [Desulfobacula sp.]